MKEVWVIKRSSDNGPILAVIEGADGVDKDTVLINWMATFGLSEKAAWQFDILPVPVTPWTELKDMFTPYSERTQ